MIETIEVQNENASAGVKLECVDEPCLRENLRAQKVKVARDMSVADLIGLLVAHYDGQMKQGIVMAQCDLCNGVAPEALPSCPFCGEPNESPAEESEVDLTSAPSVPGETVDTFPDLPRVTPEAIERARSQSEEDEGPSDAYPTHEAAGLFPMLLPEELKKLAEDIAANGLRDAIVTYRGQVLDGRNRLAACGLANVEPKFARYDGEDPFGYVLSANLHRRHLTTSQRAAVAVDVKRLLQGAAKERQEVTRAKEGQKVGSNVVANLPPSRKTRDQAADALNVSPRIVQDAAVVAAKDPELFARVKRGETTVTRALAETKKTPGPSANASRASARTPHAGQFVALSTVRDLRVALAKIDPKKLTVGGRYLADMNRTLREIGKLHDVSARVLGMGCPPFAAVKLTRPAKTRRKAKRKSRRHA